MNVLAIAGHCGNDAATHFAGTGTAITTFNVPVDQGWNEHKKTTWVKCVLFGKQGTGEAHGLAQYLTKGRFVAVTGEIVLDEWEKDGVKHAMLKCIVGEVTLGPEKNANQVRSGSAQATHPAQNQPAPTGGTGSAPGAGDFDDDIPF